MIAALNPSRYGSRIRYDLSKTPPAFTLPCEPDAGAGARAMLDHQEWVARIELRWQD